MRTALTRVFAPLIIAIVSAVPVQAQLQTRIISDPQEIETLSAFPAALTVTAGGAAGSIDVTSSFVDELRAARFLLNGVVAATVTGQFGPSDGTTRRLTVTAATSALAGTYTVQLQRGTIWQLIPSKVTVALPTATITVKDPTTAPAPLRGRYRVVLTGGRVNNRTVDHLLNADGVSDEIYFTTDVQILDKVNGTITPFMALSDRTKTYGDAGPAPLQRVKAGTAWFTGGLQSGDHFPDEGPFNPKLAFVDRQLPLRLWEGELVQGQNAVIITPILWEYDGTAFAQAITSWMNFAQAFTTKLAESKAIDQLVAGTGSGVAGMVIDIAPLVPQLVLGIVSNLGSDGDRQIGATIEGDKVVYKPQPIVLNYDRIEQFLASDIQVGNAPKGYFPIAFREPMSNKLEGDYTLYLTFQRMP